MEPESLQKNAKSSPSFLQAKWLSPALASLALVIALGGHAFTAINTVGTVELSNKLTQLESLPVMMQETDTKQANALRSLQAEISRLNTVVETQQGRITALEARPKAQASAGFTNEYKALNETALSQAKAARSEKQPLANGVNAQFDSLVRGRIKSNWVQPPQRTDEERADDEDVVVLQFSLERNGYINNVSVANTSGVMDFDNSVIEAALRTGAIPEIARASDEIYAKVKTFRLAVSPAHMR